MGEWSVVCRGDIYLFSDETDVPKCHKKPDRGISRCHIYALSEGAKDLVYFRKLLTGLGVPPTGPSECATDNQGARDLSYK